jgi:uncharacterized protein YndB with AHSA1/START domain
MAESVIHNTFVIERIFWQPPARLFTAFADPDRKRRWYATGEHHAVREYRLDFRVGGAEHWWGEFDAGTPFAGTKLASDGIHLDIVSESRIVLAADMRFADRRISCALITFAFVPEGEGTLLILTHQAAFFEGADGPEIREAGWRELLDRLEAELESAPAES